MFKSTRCRGAPKQRRPGALIVLAALLLTVVLAMLAFAIDCGMILLARTELQNAADAGALAGAAQLSTGPKYAAEAAGKVAEANRVGGAAVSLVRDQDVELGTWDKANHAFAPLSGSAQINANAVRVTCHVNRSRGNPLRLFFAPIFDRSSVDINASAIAVAASFKCGPFIGLEWVTISGGSYTDSYNSNDGAYSSGATREKGHVCSNGKITLSGGATVVKGDAHPGTTSTVRMSGGSYVVGSTSPLASPMRLPPVNPGTAATLNDNGNVQKSANGIFPLSGTGDYKLSGGDTALLATGTYYFSNLSLSGGSSVTINGPTIIYVAGNVDISGGSILNTTQKAANCQLFGMGSKVVLSGSSQWYGVVYAPTADVTRSSGSSDFFGMAVGKTLTLSGGGGCHYDEALDALAGIKGGARLVD